MDATIIAGLVGGGIVIAGNALVWVFGFGKTISRVETKCDSFAATINGKGGIREDIGDVRKDIEKLEVKTDGISRHVANLEGTIQTYIDMKEKLGKRRKSNT